MFSKQQWLFRIVLEFLEYKRGFTKNKIDGQMIIVDGYASNADGYVIVADEQVKFY